MANPIGERFVRALADKNTDELKAMLRTDVDFRAMTPGSFWEANGIDSLVDDILLGQWFAPEDRITGVGHIDTDDVGPRSRIGYRLTVISPDGEYLVDQQAYYETDGDRISWLRIMCAGYLPTG